MMSDNNAISVYFHPGWFSEQVSIGTLNMRRTKAKCTYSFEYDPRWLVAGNNIYFDPGIHQRGGLQFSKGNHIFGMFSDAMPNSWGRKLMKAVVTRNYSSASLSELDYLLAAQEHTRMGALRFKKDADVNQSPVQWKAIAELQLSAIGFEKDNEQLDDDQLRLLIHAGSSLGGARPKANVIDENGELWIAKFPSVADDMDKAAWEYLAHLLAVQSGLNMADCKLKHIYGKHRAFFTKRFDREGTRRIHFSSAMTMTGNNEDIIRDRKPSYLEIAEFMLLEQRSAIADLPQLWRRIVFNIAISNTDDHLRNHGFLLGAQGWQLSPAFDLNPSVDKAGLGLNIDLHNNDLDLDLAKSVGPYFQLSGREMDSIIEEVTEGTANWRELATQLGIPRAEQERMSSAFTLDNDRPSTRGRRR